MRALEEFKKWQSYVEMSDDLEVAFTTGFNRAVELMEDFLKEKQENERE